MSRPVLRGSLVEEGRVIRLVLFLKHIRLNANAQKCSFFFLGETRRPIPRDDFVSGGRYLRCLVVALRCALLAGLDIAPATVSAAAWEICCVP